MSVSMEDRLKRRKLDALKRGVHRVTGGEGLPMSTHVVGIGQAGIDVITETLLALEPGAPKFTALAIDIGDQGLAPLRTLAAGIPAAQAEIACVTLAAPSRAGLVEALRGLPDCLQLEYPRYTVNPSAETWLPEGFPLPAVGGPLKRAVAKAVYAQAYYEGGLKQALRSFAAGVDDARAQSVVAIAFGMGDGTGSGMAADLARHLSNAIFGRRILVAGIGIAPCEGDPADSSGAALFALLNELDCLGDEDKNSGVVVSCGELFRNPFTAGFILVPQQHVWAATQDLAQTRRRVSQELGALLTQRGGANFWELLRLLNWVAAPSTQHSAARTPWGPRWIHVLGYADTAGPVALGPALAGQMGLLPGYAPEYIEMRVPDAHATDAGLVQGMGDTFKPDAPPQVVAGGRDGSVQFILPCASKLDLQAFAGAHASYHAQSADDRLLSHALLLEQGVLLCEPSTRLAGMAGASLWSGAGWVAVPYDGLHPAEAPDVHDQARVREFGEAI